MSRLRGVTLDLPVQDIILYFENHQTTDGRILIDTTWPDYVPLVINHRTDPKVVGAVVNLYRRDVHGIEAVCGTPTRSLAAYVGRAPQAEFYDGLELFRDGVRMSSGARLTHIVLGYAPCWLGLEL